MGHYVSVETKKTDLTRLLNFQISMYCNKNQPNDYIFDYILCEIKNKKFGYIKETAELNLLSFFIILMFKYCLPVSQ